MIVLTQEEMTRFAERISTDERFCTSVYDTIVKIEKRERQRAKEKALLDEMMRRSKLSWWRRFLEKTWREF